MSWATGLVLFWSLILLAFYASADTVHGTRSELLRESAHEIRITLAPTHATLRVRRSVWNGGRRHDQAVFDIQLPATAVATSLATRGTKGDRPFWFPGELMEAEAAAAKYQELTGIGGYYPKDPALLSWRTQQELALQVFPCAPAATKWVEYTLEMPTRYAGGRYFVELPRVGTATLAASATLHAAAPGDQLFVAGEPVAAGHGFRLDSEEPKRLELVRQAAPRFDGELASFEFADESVLTRFRVSAAARLSSVPRNARVVVVLDASHSIPAGARLGAVAAARAYLSHFESAEVELVAFDRKVTPRYGRLVPVTRALADLVTYQLPARNGSDVDRALVYADMLLARAPAASAKRILVLTDALTRAALTPDALGAAVATSGALVHVAVIREGESSTLRDDEHAWARVTRPTGGLVWSAQLSTTDEREALARVVEEWARPKALDHFELSANDALLSDGVGRGEYEALEGRLPEGEGIDLLAIAKRTTAALELRGELWAEPVTMRFEPDAVAARRWAALVFGTELLAQLSEPEMMVLARHGGAVSPVTSYLAIEPGVRPSTEGLEWGTGIGYGEGFALGGIGTRGHGGGSALSPADRQKYLERLVTASLAQCGGSGRAVDVEIETTLHEIVDIPRFELAASPVPAACGTSSADVCDARLTHCLREAIWTFALPRGFTNESERFKIHT